MNNDLLEIFSCHDWAIEPIAGQQMYKALMTAIANHQDGDGKTQKTSGFFLSKMKSEECGKLFVGDIHRIENRLYWRDEELAEDDQIINCVVIEGAVTRNGGACTYGSKDHRDQILYANTIPQVIGHIFFINTPGGMVSAMPDYTLAIENCRENHKPTVAKIDGICYSAGEWIASLCDYVIATNPEDGFGCIGAMSVGSLAPHGSVNTITQERLFYLVGKGSPDKNRGEIEAGQGNDELLQQRADQNTEKFHAHMRANRPAVTDDLLTGKTYAAREVMGKLVDEIGDTARAIECVFQLADGTLKPARDMEVLPQEKPDEEPEDREHMEQMAAQVETAILNNSNDMTQEEKKAAAAEEQQVATPETQEAPAAQEEQVETPAEAAPAEETPAAEPAAEPEAPAEEPAAEEAPAAEEPTAEPEAPAAEPAAEPEAPAAEPAAEAADAQAELAKVTETLHTAEALVAQRDKEIAEKDSLVADLQQQLADAQKALDDKVAEDQSVIAERDKTIAENAQTIADQQANIDKLTKQVADLKAEVKELANQPTPMVDEKSGIPAGNGTGAAPQQQGSRVKRGMSYEEIREAMKK